jgi:hypothetical protein
MFQNVYGSPKKCLNRNCKALFDKDSHLGYLQKSDTEVFAVLRCHKCKDTFLVCQMFNMVWDYYEELPASQKREKEITDFPITQEEIENVRWKLDTDNSVLSSVRNGNNEE